MRIYLYGVVGCIFGGGFIGFLCLMLWDYIPETLAIIILSICVSAFIIGLFLFFRAHGRHENRIPIGIIIFGVSLLALFGMLIYHPFGFSIIIILMPLIIICLMIIIGLICIYDGIVSKQKKRN